MAVNETAIGELTAVGRREGKLTLDDVKRILPVERMSPDELAEVMGRLEDAGIEVDLDPALLRLRPGAAPPAPAAAAAPPPAEPATAARPAHRAGGGGTAAPSGRLHVYPAEPAAGGRSRGVTSADTIVMGVVLAVCIVLIIFFAA